MNVIPYAQMIAEMDRLDGRGKPLSFSVVFATADRKKHTGGQVHIMGNPTPFLKDLAKRIPDNTVTESQVRKFTTSRGGEEVVDKRPRSPKQEKDPRHRKNHTRNLQVLTSGEIRKVHTRLILYFNEKKVIP